MEDGAEIRSSKYLVRSLRAGLISAGTVVIGLLLALDAQAANLKQWLDEEVTWIISKDEKRAFRELKSDEAHEEFVKDFWRRRDPSPSTQRNEYREEHYRRLVYVNEVFREGIPGWRTDRGRVYILHGPPDRESYFRSRSTISPLREVQHTERNPNTIVWTYHQLPDAKYYKGEIRLVFQPSFGLARNNFALSESRTAQQRASQLARLFGPAADPNWTEADLRYKLVMAGPPSIVNASGADLPTTGVGEASKYLDDVLRSPGELLDQREKEQKRRQQSQSELRESVQAQVVYSRVPFEVSLDRFYRSGADWLMPLHLRIPIEQLEEDGIDVYAALYDGKGQLFDEFIDSVWFDREGMRESEELTIHYYNSFTAPSGEYVLKVVFRELVSQRSGYQEEAIELNSIRPEKVTLASLLLTNRVEVLPQISTENGVQPLTRESVGNCIVFNQARLLPNPSQRFRPEDYLLLYMQLWVPKPEHKLSVNANFIREGAIVKRLEPRFVEDLGEACREYGTAVPLRDFAPGDYTVQIQVVDHTAKSFDIQRASFQVLSPLSARVAPVAGEERMQAP
jgi:GWxTD domain-containing protein